MKNLAGFKNDFLEVISLIGIRYRGVYYWECKCRCGALVNRSTYEITSSKIKVCHKCPNKKHKKRKRNYTFDTRGVRHGLADKHPLYQTWQNMKQRCYNPKDPKYRIYGAKDIFLCEEWKQNFKVFYDWAISNGWKKDLTIDRKDPSKGYSSINCQFLTRSENTKKVHAIRRAMKCLVS